MLNKPQKYRETNTDRRGWERGRWGKGVGQRGQKTVEMREKEGIDFLIKVVGTQNNRPTEK